MKAIASQTITHLSVIALTLCLASTSQAQVYKTVDEKGTVTYSDQPAPQAEEIQLPEPNTTEAINTQPKPPPPQPVAEPYSQLKITQPSDQTIIPNGLVELTIKTAIAPKLQTDHQLQLRIDGSIYGTSRQHFTLSSINRGERQLQLEVIDSTGKVLKQSPPITLFVYRP